MSDNIPFEIQEEIIKRLPIKSLIRFISVSKPWKSLICSPKFIVDHQTHPHHHHHLLVKYKVNYWEEKYISIDNDDDSFPQHKAGVTIPESVSLAEKTTRIVDSSCGLLCFFSATKNIAIVWNPSIKRSVDIFVPNVLENSSFKTIVGFGVCPVTLDPKLVNITFIRTPYKFEAINSIPWQVEVFTLTSNAWRSLSINLPRKTTTLLWNNQVFIDGIIYWLATNRMRVNTTLRWRWYNSIMSFDITTEEFTEICLPDNLLHSTVFSISKLRESLVVIEEKWEPMLGVWKMEHGVTKTFTKLFNICTPNATLYNVHGFRNNGQPIIEFGSRFQHKGLYVYEPSSGYIECSGIYGEIDRVSSYIETLLLLDQ